MFDVFEALYYLKQGEEVFLNKQQIKLNSKLVLEKTNGQHLTKKECQSKKFSLINNAEMR